MNSLIPVCFMYEEPVCFMYEEQGLSTLRVAFLARCRSALCVTA
jgi:hypothetical protein